MMGLVLFFVPSPPQPSPGWWWGFCWADQSTFVAKGGDGLPRRLIRCADVPVPNPREWTMGGKASLSFPVATGRACWPGRGDCNRLDVRKFLTSVLASPYLGTQNGISARSSLQVASLGLFVRRTEAQVAGSVVSMLEIL